ncbi:MAG: HipA domain-containing protein, partial [Mobilicoccus sp.]|nr:HipA domain-containing protein [Mobilicoccus sp.]
DDHLRNLGLLRERSGWRLSPAFDLNPNPHPSSFQTSILGEDSKAGRLSALHEATDSFGVSAAEAQDIATQVQGSVAGWRGVAVSHGATVAELGLMESAFSA